MATIIIAEAGVNHNGNFENACKLVKAAKQAGADFVKFQTYISEKVISKFAIKAEYQKKTTSTNESQLDMVKKLELSFDRFTQLNKLCKEVGIQFLSTPFDLDSLAFLDTFNQTFWKVPS